MTDPIRITQPEEWRYACADLSEATQEQMEDYQIADVDDIDAVLEAIQNSLDDVEPGKFKLVVGDREDDQLYLRIIRTGEEK